MIVREKRADNDPAGVSGPMVESEPQRADRTSRRSQGIVRILDWLRLTGPYRSRTRRALVAITALGLAAWIGAWQVYGWHHLLAGKRSLRNDHCREALIHFQAALQTWPEDPAVALLAARAARRAGDYGSAEYYLKQSQFVPSQADAAAFERVLLRACQGEVDQVGAYCQALLQQDHPETPLILEALAAGNQSLLRLNEATDALERWLEIEPDQPHATFLKGRLLLQAGSNEEALKFLGRAVELDPQRDDARLLLAGLYLDLGQAQEALPHLKIVCSRRPDSVPAKARMAQALILIGQPEQALPLLDEVLREQPDLLSALLERGKLALRDGQLEQAQEWLQKACQRDPGDRAAHYQLLQCLTQQGKVKEARQMQEHLEEMDQEAAQMREIVTTKLPTRPFDPELQAELGELLLKVRADNEGLAWLNRALQLDPRQKRAHAALAKYYQSLGQSSKAQQHRTLAESSDSLPVAPK